MDDTVLAHSSQEMAAPSLQGLRPRSTLTPLFLSHPHIRPAPKSNFYPLKMYLDHFSPPGLLLLERNHHHPSSECSDWTPKSSLCFHRVGLRPDSGVCVRWCHSSARKRVKCHSSTWSQSQSPPVTSEVAHRRDALCLSDPLPLCLLLSPTAPAPNKPGAPLPPGLSYLLVLWLGMLNIHMARSITFFSLFAYEIKNLPAKPALTTLLKTVPLTFLIHFAVLCYSIDVLP